MRTIENLLFVFCFTAIPLAMMVVLAYRLVRWLRERRAWGQLREEGWEPIPEHDPGLRDALQDLHIGVARSRLVDRARLESDGEPLTFVVHQPPRRAQSELNASSPDKLLIAPRSTPGPIGVVYRRTGGLMERAAVKVAGALGAQPIDAPGWEWAVVSGPTPASGWPPEMGAALANLLRPGETLHLGARHLAIRLPDDALASPVLREARARVAALRAALGEVSERA